MKRLLILLLIPMLFCSCRESEQIDELAFVKTLGIDFSEGQLEITCAYVVPSGEKETPRGESVSVTCKTLSQGLNLVEASTDRKVFFGQIENVIIGENAARRGIAGEVDYLVRSDELRFDIPVIVVKGESAKKLIEDTSESETHISQQITKLLKSNYSTSVASEVQLAALVEMLEDPFKSPYLPYIERAEKGISINGYGVFNEDKLMEFFSQEESLGINFLNNDVENRIIVVNDQDKSITLKLTKSKTRIRLKDGIFRVNIKLMSEVVQAEGTINNLDDELTQGLIARQNEEIKRVVEASLTRLKNMGCDVSTFGDTFHNVSPKKAEEYMDKWNETFPYVKIEVSVTSSLDPSKISGKPVKQGE